MKLERISENQIKCTFTRKELADRHIKLSELAYGAPKARELFQEVMQEAESKLGFEPENSPVMIEAIPMSRENLVMIVTKVEDADELDTRFSRFTQSTAGGFDEDFEEADSEDDFYHVLDDNDEDLYETPQAEPSKTIDINIIGAKPEDLPDSIKNVFDGIMNSFLSNFPEQIAKLMKENQEEATEESAEEVPQKNPPAAKLIVFDSLQTAIKATKQIASFYFGYNSLYKDKQTGKYYLIFTNSHNSMPEFNRAFHILSEYGTTKKITPGMPQHIGEHCEVIVGDDAVQTLAVL